MFHLKLPDAKQKSSDVKQAARSYLNLRAAMHQCQCGFGCSLQGMFSTLRPLKVREHLSSCPGVSRSSQPLWVNSDRHPLNPWLKSVLLHVGGSGPGRGFGFSCCCCCCQTCPLPGHIHPPHPLAILPTLPHSTPIANLLSNSCYRLRMSSYCNAGPSREGQIHGQIHVPAARMQSYTCSAICSGVAP